MLVDLPEIRQAVVPGRRGQLPRHLQSVLTGVTDMTNELYMARQQLAEKDAVIGQLEAQLQQSETVSEERAQEIDRLMDEREDTLLECQEVRLSSLGRAHRQGRRVTPSFDSVSCLRRSPGARHCTSGRAQRCPEGRHAGQRAGVL